MAGKAGSAYDRLKPNHQVFVDFYITGNGNVSLINNGAQSAIAAGFSTRTARQTGSRLLTNVDIKRAIRERQTEHKARQNNLADRLMSNARTVYERCMVDAERVVDDKGEELGTLTFDPTNALKAIDTQAKLGGAYAPEKSEAHLTLSGLLRKMHDEDG